MAVYGCPVASFSAAQPRVVVSLPGLAFPRVRILADAV
ncbi:hypothetical protein L083_1413 [Actinoplanes sp. N902-109]|nr:hypothetical protein L083_1413 [Actinoplanes sp. N902-109]